MYHSPRSASTDNANSSSSGCDVCGAKACACEEDDPSEERYAEKCAKMDCSPRGPTQGRNHPCGTEQPWAESQADQHPAHYSSNATSVEDTSSEARSMRGGSSGTTLHGGIARCMSADTSGLTFASAVTRLQECGMILELGDLSYVGSKQQNSTATSANELGRGSMGVLYSATLRRGDAQRAVAVKHCLVRGAVQGKALEGSTDMLWSMLMGAKIKPHPNIIEFLGCILHTTHGPLLVYELIDGINMHNYYQIQQGSRGNKWRPKAHIALDWSRQMFAALDWLHSNEAIIHRDVKPSNLMVYGEDMRHVKMIDFGLSRQASHPRNDTSRLEGAWSLATPGDERAKGHSGGKDLTSKTGTYRFMAPEVFLHGEQAPGAAGARVQGYGPPADIYSATVTLHFIVTGRLAFDRMPPTVIAEAAAREGLRPPLDLILERLIRYGNLADEIVELVEAGWAALPDGRPTARLMMEDLQLFTTIAEDTWRRNKALTGQVKGAYETLKKSLSSSSFSSTTSTHSSSSTPTSFKGMTGHVKGAFKSLSRSISSSALSSSADLSLSECQVTVPRSMSQSNLFSTAQ